MPRRTAQVFESVYLIDTAQIFRESIRVILLHPTQFHSISIFFFSPLSISLFISHFLVRYFPQIPSWSINITDHLLGHPLLKILSKTIIHLIICFPSFITFSLIGRAATIQAVSDNYNGISLDRRRLLTKSGMTWIKLLHTSFWEFFIVLGLFGALLISLATVPKLLFSMGLLSSRMLGFLCVLGFLGIPFCVVFAQLMVVGNLAKVLSVLEGECYGLESLLKANNLIKGRRQTALIMTLLSNMSLRLVEFLFEFRICRDISIWEAPLLVSMYSSVLVFDSVMNVVFYYACKP